MSTQVLWFATRGAGIVSLLLFTGVVVLGVLTSVRWQAAGWPRFLSAEVHRSIALLSLVFLAIHIVTAIVDPYTSLGWLAAILPLASPYRPLWVGLGAVAFDLLLALTVSSLLRARIGHRAWRAIHWAAYAAWPIALAHGIGSGSDAGAPWLIGTEVACIGLVAIAIGWRLTAGRPGDDLPATVAAVDRDRQQLRAAPGAVRVAGRDRRPAA